ncbi:MAG: hypothetical protein ACQESC_02860 [Nanobdellota archaeon]
MKLGRLTFFAFFTMLFGSLATKLAFAADATAFDHISTIGSSFTYLFNGDVGQFLSTLLEGAPVVGVFIMVYILGRFISGSTIFKKVDKNVYENMFGIGLALVALATPSVYGFIVSIFGGTFVIILALILLVTFIAVAIIRGKSSHSEAKGELHENKAEEHKAHQTENKEEHELDQLGKLQHKEEKDLNAANTDLKSIKKTGLSVDKSIKIIKSLLNNLASESSSESAEKLKKQIMSQAAHIGNNIKKIHKNEHHLKRMLGDLQKIDHRGLNLTKDEANLFNDLKKHLQKVYAGKHGVDPSDPSAKNAVNKEESAIKNHVAHLKQAELTREHLEKQAKDLDSLLTHSISELSDKHKEFVNFMTSGDTNGAINSFGDIEKLKDKIRDEDAKIAHLIPEQQQLTNRVSQLSNDLKSIIGRVI